MTSTILGLMKPFMLICAVLGVFVSGRACAAGETRPVNPAGMAAFKAAARGVGIDRRGIWPPIERLKNAKKLVNSSRVAFYQKLLSRVLKKSVHPDEGQWNSSEWLVVPHLRHGEDYLLGQFASPNKKVSRIEFQVTKESPASTLTIISEELFPNKKFTKQELRGLLGDLLNIPEDVIPNLELGLQSITVGDDKTVLTKGRVLDTRHKVPRRHNPPSNVKDLPPPRKGRKVFKYVIPKKKREWFSPMHFWIAKGRLCVTICTIDWKSGDRPMRGGCPD